MNPTDFIKGIQNPKQFVMNIMGQNSNPVINNLMQMAQKGNAKEIETFARNFCRERNRDFDTEFADFMNQMKR